MRARSEALAVPSSELTRSQHIFLKDWWANPFFPGLGQVSFHIFSSRSTLVYHLQSPDD